MAILQRTPEWHAKRAGKITASRCKDIVVGKSGKYLKARTDYIEELCSDILTGHVDEEDEGFKQTQWGIDVEPAARAALEARQAYIITEVDFIEHPTLIHAGCSPDGIVLGDESSAEIAFGQFRIGKRPAVGGCEIKCPWNRAIHWATLRDGMPEAHQWQVQFQLWITGAQWWDFVSFHPHYKNPEMRLYVERHKRNEAIIKTIAAEVDSVWAEVLRQLRDMDERYPKAVA